MFYVLEFEIGILVNKYMYRYVAHHLMYNCDDAAISGSVYPETLCILKNLPLEHFPNLSCML